MLLCYRHASSLFCLSHHSMSFLTILENYISSLKLTMPASSSQSGHLKFQDSPPPCTNTNRTSTALRHSQAHKAYSSVLLVNGLYESHHDPSARPKISLSHLRYILVLKIVRFPRPLCHSYFLITFLFVHVLSKHIAFVAKLIPDG